MRTIILITCGAIIAATSLFGLFYNPGYLWMDSKRKIAVGISCTVFTVAIATLLISHS